MIPLVKGPADAGKSTLIRELFQNAPNVWKPVLFEAGPNLQPELFFRSLAEVFLPGESESHLVDALLRSFENLSMDGTLPVVVIDDAHQLPEATLAIILEMHARNPREVRFLLFAEPSVEDLLTPLRDRNLDLQPLQELEMPRLNVEQIKQYVARLLRAQGGERPPLSDAQMDRICRESDGLPGRITRLVDEMGGSRINGLLKKISPLQMAGLAVAVGLVLLILLFQNAINALFEEKPDEPPPVAELQEPGREIPLALPPQVEEPPAVEPVQEPEMQPQPPAPPETAEEVVEPVQPPADEQAATDSTGEEAAPAPETTETEQVEPKEEPTKQVEAPPSAPEKEPVAEAKTPEKPAPAAEEPKPEPSAPVEKPALPEKKPAPTVADSGGIKSESWLLLQNPGAYTLQLAGMQDKAGVPRMVELYKLPGPFAHYRTIRSGAAWYPVLYGVYPNHKAALAARDKLAVSHGLKGAWARSFGSIQREIRAQ
jgi:DamX protein